MDQSSRVNEQVSNEKKHALLATVLEYLELFLACLGAILLVFSFGVRICTVSGESMLPTLENGQNLLVSNLFYEPAQGDIIIFHQTSDTVDRFNEPIVKRVIATEGQHVRIDFTDKTVSVDGNVLHEDYIQLIYRGEYTVFAEHHMSFIPAEDGTTHRVFEATVPKGHLFVMGDNRNASADSRTSVIGFVDERRVLGRAVLRLTPFSAVGAID
ncbi:MAG: signal peptidase I [Clostridia bacterium]|nr:signal peptidase I [Clostridia bacterium]